MTLEFQPYFQPDRNRNRESLANLTQTVSGIGDDLQKYRQQQDDNRYRQQQLDIEKQRAKRDQQTWERDNNGTLPLQGDQRMGSVDMTPQGTTSWNPSPLDIGRQSFAQTPTYNESPSQPQQFASAGTPDTGSSIPSQPQAMHAPGINLSGHVMNWMQQGQPSTYDHPEMKGMMSDPNNPMSQWNQYASIPGSKNRAEYQLFNKNQGEDSLHSSESSKNLAEAMKNEAEAGYYKNYKGKEDHLNLSEKEDQFYQKEWDKIVHDTDPTQATSRSLLGRAGVANFQANRAIKTLSNPVVTNQEAGNVMADLASIYQGGSATDFGMSHQAYNTMYGKVQGLMQSITGKPTDALPDAIKSRLLGVLSDMKQTNQGVIKQKLDLTERAKGKVISRYPKEWKDLRSTLEGDQSDYNGLGQTPPPASNGNSGWSYVGKVQ